MYHSMTLQRLSEHPGNSKVRLVKKHKKEKRSRYLSPRLRTSNAQRPWPSTRDQSSALHAQLMTKLRVRPGRAGGGSEIIA